MEYEALYTAELRRCLAKRDAIKRLQKLCEDYLKSRTISSAERLDVVADILRERYNLHEEDIAAIEHEAFSNAKKG